jgi:predicted lactoylglutathione lyase
MEANARACVIGVFRQEACRVWNDSPMEQRLSLVTLGVRELARARTFYEALGWKTNAAPDDDVVFFKSGGMVVALWGRDELQKDTAVPDSGGWGGVTLAHNVRSPGEVDAVIAEAEAAGGTIARVGAPTFWGGYSGVFVDPEGHAWEVAHNPSWTIAADGSVTLAS